MGLHRILYLELIIQIISQFHLLELVKLFEYDNLSFVIVICDLGLLFFISCIVSMIKETVINICIS